MHILQHCHFSPFETFVGRVAELNLSNGTIRLTWRTLFRSVRRNMSRAVSHGSWFAQPCDPLIMVWCQGDRAARDCLDHASQRVGPLEFSRSCQSRGIESFWKCQDGASWWSHRGTAKPPVRWATCSSAGVLFQESPGEPFGGAYAAGRGTNINTKPPVNKAAGRVPATPEQVCGMPPCERLASA